MDRRSQRRGAALVAAVAFAVALVASTVRGTMAAPPASGFAGSYLLTQVGGGGVQRSVLSLGADGRATMRTDFSRYTQRPEPAPPVPPVVESGTWHEHGGRAIVHFVSSSSEEGGTDTHKPQFDDMAFTKAGCSLRLVSNASSGSTFGARGLEFTKRRCTAP